MLNIEIKWSPAVSFSTASKAVEETLGAAGLEITLRGTLRKFPGCQHWHARKPKRSGTLEVTLWPQAHRAWITIQSGRTAGWIDEELTHIRAKLRRQLAAEA